MSITHHFIPQMFLTPSFYVPHEISNIIFSLSNNYYGINNIPTKLYKEIDEFICEPLSKIITQFFTSGIFPNVMKAACLWRSTVCKQYRPISVLPILSKITEKCMYQR